MPPFNKSMGLVNQAFRGLNTGLANIRNNMTIANQGRPFQLPGAPLATTQPVATPVAKAAALPYQVEVPQYNPATYMASTMYSDPIKKQLQGLQSAFGASGYGTPQQALDVMNQRVDYFRPQYQELRRLEAQALAAPAVEMANFNRQFKGGAGGPDAMSQLASALQSMGRTQSTRDVAADVLNQSRGRIEDISNDLYGQYQAQQNQLLQQAGLLQPLLQAGLTQEEAGATRGFGNLQNMLGQQFQSSEQEKQRGFQADQQRLAREFEAEQARIAREWQAAEAEKAARRGGGGGGGGFGGGLYNPFGDIGGGSPGGGGLPSPSANVEIKDESAPVKAEMSRMDMEIKAMQDKLSKQPDGIGKMAMQGALQKAIAERQKMNERYMFLRQQYNQQLAKYSSPNPFQQFGAQAELSLMGPTFAQNAASNLANQRR